LCVGKLCTVAAAAAANAAFGKKLQLKMRRKTFGIVTPPASKRAAFGKNRCADSGTIMHGKTLNIKNGSIHNADIPFF